MHNNESVREFQKHIVDSAIKNSAIKNIIRSFIFLFASPTNDKEGWLFLKKK